MTNKNTKKKVYSYIRFSSALQAKGDSLRRQTEASEKWAEKHGYIIVENMTDLGLSAYKGNHASEGALGVFLAKVKEGGIEEGSVLLVESLDRLSRQEIVKSLSQFLGIIAAGIKVITLIDGYEYTRDSINDIGNLMYSLMIMHRAYEESHTKSKRLLSVWDHKIKNASESPVTSQSPGWLILNKPLKKFEVIPARAEIVKQIFALCIEGYGKRAIAKHLNTNEVETWNDGEVWYDSYIQKILENKSTYGVYIPHRQEKKDFEVDGYYPAVIDKETFYRAKAARESRRKKGGRSSAGFGNIFMHLCKCLECGNSMRFINKGKPPKGGKYLACNVAKLGGACSSHKNWRYEPLETLLLLHIAKKVDWYSFFNNTKTAARSLEERRTTLKAELSDVEKTFNNYETILTELDSTAVKKIAEKYNAVALKLESLEQEIKELDDQIAETNFDHKDLENDLNAALIKLELNDDPIEDHNNRLQVNKLLKEAISGIWFDSKKELLAYKLKDGSLHILAASKKHLQEVQETARMEKTVRLIEQLSSNIAGLDVEIRTINNESEQIEAEIRLLEAMQS